MKEQISPVIIKKAIDMYLYKFRLLPSEIQNKNLYWSWIAENWDKYEDTYPYNKKYQSNYGCSVL